MAGRCVLCGEDFNGTNCPYCTRSMMRDIQAGKVPPGVNPGCLNVNDWIKYRLIERDWTNGVISEAEARQKSQALTAELVARQAQIDAFRAQQRQAEQQKRDHYLY